MAVKRKSTKHARSKRSSPTKPRTARSRSAPAVAPNGLASYAAHRAEERGEERFRALAAERENLPAFALDAVAPLASLDAETAARRHLQQAFDSDAVPELVSPSVGDAASEYKSLGTETVPLTGVRTVKFRQQLNKVPVYGSLVTVELDDDNECLAINTSLGQPADVNAIAKISPADAVTAVAQKTKDRDAAQESVPRLFYYFDQKAKKWRLVYILEDVVQAKSARGIARADFVVDASTGKIVTELPRTPSASARDGRGVERTFEVTPLDGTRHVLRNALLNVHTHDFKFGDPEEAEDQLPGAMLESPPAWSPQGVSAHANAEIVVQFIRDVLKRNNIDNRGSPVISSINCVVVRHAQGRQWLNAYWNSKQMVYGQRMEGEVARSLAENVDVVAHELFHGITEHTARLEYSRQSGALNESISDIFGVLISNVSVADIDQWNWEIGEELLPGGHAFRNMKQPALRGQPQHMDNWVTKPNTERGDWGGVHANSGIHNFAMFKLAVSQAPGGAFLFSAEELASLFYIALIQYLSRTSGFSDCRRAVVLAAKTLYRQRTPEERAARVAAIEAAYSAAGIN